jgi:hypothetical protein
MSTIRCYGDLKSRNDNDKFHTFGTLICVFIYISKFCKHDRYIYIYIYMKIKIKER